jgi:hypothetical protein
LQKDAVAVEAQLAAQPSGSISWTRKSWEALAYWMDRDIDNGNVTEGAQGAWEELELASPAAQPTPEAIIKAALEAAANECSRMMMFPGGRQESFAHHGVDAASVAIRALDPASIIQAAREGE